MMGKAGGILIMEDDKKIRAKMEEWESIRAYDAAIASGNESVPFE
jgi:hypothetical protein